MSATGDKINHARQRTRGLVADDFERSEPSSPSSLDGLHQGLAERGQQAREGNGPAIFRPRLAVHPDPELAVAGEGNPSKLDFEILIASNILDRNSNVCFHKYMISTALQKSRVHGLVQSQSYINSWAASSIMRFHTFIFALAVVLACGCSTEHFTKSHGDVGQFILQQAIRYGGNLTITNGLPVVTSQWRYLEDAHGMQIRLPPRDYSKIEAYLNQAFAGSRQFGPKTSEDNDFWIHEYRMSPKGGGVQLSGDSHKTLVVILKPFGKS